MFAKKGRENRTKSSSRSKSDKRRSEPRMQSDEQRPPKGDTQAKGQFGRPDGETKSSPPSMLKGTIKKGVS